MLKNYIIIKQVTIFILPYIFLYALYIQMNGENSPGGGFQSGVIFSSGVIAADLIYGKMKLNKYFSLDSLLFIAAFGVLIYALTGMVSLFSNDNYLNYYSLSSNKIFAQHLGIFLIEIGVGLTVAAVMSMIYFLITYGNE